MWVGGGGEVGSVNAIEFKQIKERACNRESVCVGGKVWGGRMLYNSY